MKAQYRNSSPPVCSIALQLPESLQAFATNRNSLRGFCVIGDVEVQGERIKPALPLDPAHPPPDLMLRIGEQTRLTMKLVTVCPFDQRGFPHRADGFFLYRTLWNEEARQKFGLFDGRNCLPAIEVCEREDRRPGNALLRPELIRDFHPVPGRIEQHKCPGAAVAIEDRVQLGHFMIASRRQLP